MQLNPARGRKPEELDIVACTIQYGLCSSTPRGDGNRSVEKPTTPLIKGLCSSTPRGDGNFFRDLRATLSQRSLGLCSSTPRGDGNQVH